MKKINHFLLLLCLSLLTACGHGQNVEPSVHTSSRNSDMSSPQSSPSENSSLSNSASQNESSSTTSNQVSESTSSVTSSEDKSNTNDTQDNDHNVINKRINTVINATLFLESKKSDTTVDYQSQTMVQNGRKVGFEIIPSMNHENDFMEGLIKEAINNSDESYDVTLYQYQFIDNKLNLIDPFSGKIVYTGVAG